MSDPVNKELMDVFVQRNIVDRSGHGVPKVVRAYGKEAFRLLGAGILVTIPFYESGFGVSKDSTADFTENFTENEKKILHLIKENKKATTSELSS